MPKDEQQSTVPPTPAAKLTKPIVSGASAELQPVTPPVSATLATSVTRPKTSTSEPATGTVFDQFGGFVQQLAGVAKKLEFMVTAVLLLGACAVAIIGFKLYTPDGLLWWNVIKLGVFVLPLLVWFVFWRIIKQLIDAPQEMVELASDNDNPLGSTLVQIRQVSFKQPKGVISLLSSVRQLRNTEGLETLLDIVSGVALLANPLFAIAVVCSLLASFALMIIAPVIWYFF